MVMMLFLQSQIYVDEHFFQPQIYADENG